MMRRTCCHCPARSHASMALAKVTDPGGHPSSAISSSRLTASDLLVSELGLEGREREEAKRKTLL